MASRARLGAGRFALGVTVALRPFHRMPWEVPGLVAVKLLLHPLIVFALMLLLGPPTHLLGDRLPHQDIASRRFEIVSGVACLGLLALRRGPFDAATLGGFAASRPRRLRSSC